ncbi:elongation factor P [Striga asiatica]|uniref:Elongation factor P n=1 Tax=Striga asiatica TaxID=4170 RepID=A0A5A7RE47_STRAF|nr:elongation factor P [Striga asiatica]
MWAMDLFVLKNLWYCSEFLHVKPGKGAAFVRTMLRNYVTGNQVEKTFRAGSKIEEADIFKETKQFSYKDGAQYVFMDLTTYEEYRLNESDVGDKSMWLKEGMDCNLLFWKDKIIDFELPNIVKLTVVQVDPGIKGDTVQGGSKPATLETGAVVTVPLFINIGDEILVDTRTGHQILRLFHGSLDRLLYGRSDGPPLDWNCRMKVALCTAQGLTFLHEEGPIQAMFHDFSTSNIQIDKDFSAKLSGYGCIGHIPETDISSSSVAVANLSVETLERGLLTPKSNVWSFGIVLLELLTGCPLSQLKGRFPARAARTVADIAQRCLQADPSDRPTMRVIVEHLKTIQDLKYASRFPLQEPGKIGGKQMFRSPSLNGIVPKATRSNLSPSPPSARPKSVTPSHGLPLALPPRSSSYTLLLEESDRQESRRFSSSSTVCRLSVKDFDS